MNISDAETEFSSCSQNDEHNMFCPLRLPLVHHFSTYKPSLGENLLLLCVLWYFFLPFLQWHTLGFTLCKQIASDYHSKLQT